MLRSSCDACTSYLSLRQRVAHCPESLSRDRDQHEDGGVGEHRPHRIPESGERHPVPVGLPIQEAADQGALDHHVQDQEAVKHGETEEGEHRMKHQKLLSAV